MPEPKTVLGLLRGIHGGDWGSFMSLCSVLEVDSDACVKEYDRWSDNLCYCYYTLMYEGN